MKRPLRHDCGTDYVGNVRVPEKGVTHWEEHLPGWAENPREKKPRPAPGRGETEKKHG